MVENPRVSRYHALIRRLSGQTVLLDLNSANGTAVNGEPVTRAVLRDGDRILLAGAVELTYHTGHE